MNCTGKCEECSWISICIQSVTAETVELNLEKEPYENI